MAGRFISLLLSIALFSSSIGAQQAEHPVLDQLATDYYVNKYRVAADEARRRLRIQERASGIEDRIAGLLGPDYAGLWYDHEDRGRLKIGITRAASGLAGQLLALVDQHGLGDDARLIEVRFTQAELEARRDALREPLWDMQLAGHARTGYDVRLNSVVVTALRHLPAAEEARIREIGTREGVTVRRVDAPHLLFQPLACNITYCNPPLKGGRQVIAPWPFLPVSTTCTGAFIARHRVQTNRLLMLTAGHCIDTANTAGATSWNARDESMTSLTIGPTFGGVLGGGPGIDAGVIRISPLGDWFVPTPVAQVVIKSSSQTTYDPEYEIKGDSFSTLGQILCYSGGWTGTHCAEVSDLGDDLTSTEGWVLKNAGELDYCESLPGDSGGPVIKNHKAFGIVSGVSASPGHCYTAYQGIRAAENILDVDVLFAP